MSAPGPLLIEPGAASLAVAADELIGPLSTAATPQPLPWSGGATVAVAMPTHRPLVLATLLVDLPDEWLDASVSLVVEGSPDAAQPALSFAPWSEHGTQIVVYTPPTDASGTAAPFTLRVVAERRFPDGSASALAPADIEPRLRLDLVEGVLGRLLSVLLAEKGRLRRQSRELRAMRALSVARNNALDRIGADLGCPRFSDQLMWDAGRKQVGTVPLTPRGAVEDDASYRDRLRILRGVRLPTPPWIEAAVNGPGGPGDPGAGWLAELGFGARLTVDETPNELLATFRLVAPGHAHARAELLDAIRRTHLVWPAGSAAGDTAHAGRMLTVEAVAAIGKARDALAALKLPASQPLAPSLALALQRLAARQDALGAHPYATILAGQHDDGGSRYELGLGAQLAAPDAGQLAQAVTAAQQAADPALVPVATADDPIGAWLLRACGLRTAQPLADGTVYVGALATGGLVVDIAPAPEGPLPLTLTARIETAADANHDAPLAGVVAALAADGIAPVADPAALLAAIQPTAADAGVAAALAALGLPEMPAAAQVTDVQARMPKIDPRGYVAFDLGAGPTGDIKADPSKLAAILGAAARGGASSGLPVLTAGGTIGLFLGLVDLPLAGNNLASQHTVAYRWQVRGLVGQPAWLAPRRGPTVTIDEPGEGITVVACLAYVRDGGNDPYQWRPTLPTGALLNLRQYEHLMNVVELVTPLGVRADTWSIRRQHVSVDGSGATPLPPSAARTYRRYRPQHS